MQSPLDTPTEIEELFGRRQGVIKLGLERLTAACQATKLTTAPFFIVAGTNGKGSTSGFLSVLMQELGFKVGLFTSPHLIHFNERFRVNGQDVAMDELVAALRNLQSLCPRELYESLTFFEISTLLGLLIFKNHKTTLNVFEVGLGGRLDATNILDPAFGEQIASVITSIGMDHTEFLGADIASIAREKAGVMRTGKSCLWSGLLTSPLVAHQEISKQAELRGSPLRTLGQEIPIITTENLLAERIPDYLRYNLSLAVEGCRIIDPAYDAQKKDWGSVLTKAKGLLRGRFERLRGRDREFLVDVCHNLAGARAFAAALQASGLLSNESDRLPGLVSILADKDVNGILDQLSQVLEPLILYPLEHNPRTWTSAQVSKRHRHLLWQPNLKAALSTLRCDDRLVVICGSVAGVGEAVHLIRDL